MNEAEKVMDDLATRFLEPEKNKAVSTMLPERIMSHVDRDAVLSCPYIRPKVLGEIKQKKLAAREHLRAVLNCLNHLDLDMAIPKNVLRPVDPTCEFRSHHGHVPFISNKTTGCSRWDAPNDFLDASHMRLILGADEGSPLFTAVMFLHSNHVAVRLARDELQLDCMLP